MGDSTVTGLPAIQYTGRTFDSIKELLKTHLQTKFPLTWKSFYEGDEGMAWLELCAYTFDVLSFYLDVACNESYLPTQQDRENTVRICKLIGYRLQAPRAASAEVTIELPAVYLADVVIAVGAQLESENGLTYEFLSGATIPAGSQSATATVTEGETKQDTFSSDGSTFQRFLLTGTPVIDNTIETEVDGTDWTEAESLVYGDGTSEIFQVVYDVNEDGEDIAYIEFGDGTSGKIPPAGATINASYRIGGGIEGNIALNQINTEVLGTLAGVVPATTVDVTVANDTERGSGGEDRETVQHAKYWAPQWVKTNGRAVTEQDFDVLATRFSDPTYGAFSYAKARLAQEIPELNTVDVYCLHGGTEIPLLDGTTRTIRDLAESGDDEFYVYSHDPDTGLITACRAFNARFTKYTRQLVEITLDNGTSFKCTPDHLVLLRDGSYIRADKLIPGSSLVPLYTEVVSENSWRDGYLRLYQLDGSDEMVHHMVVRDHLGGYPSRSHVCHHVDFNKQNNVPTNLELVHKHVHAKLHRELIKRLWADPDYREAQSRRASKLFTELWQDPAFRAKMAKHRPRMSKLLRDRMADPEFKERMREISRHNGRNTMAELWQDPQFRKASSKRSSARMKRTRAKLEHDPEYKKLQRMVSSKALASQWEDPKFRAKQRRLKAARNSDPEFQQKARLGRYRKLATSVLATFGRIDSDTWESTRRSIRELGRGFNFPKYGKAMETFGSVENLIKELGLNHKVTAVRTIAGVREPVYDLSVERCHNFAIANGVFVHNCWSRDSNNNPTDPGTGLIAALQAYFDNNDAGAVRVICTDTVVQAGTNLWLDISVRYKALSNYKAVDVEATLRSAVVDLFASQAIQAGKDFNIGGLYNALTNAEGVQYALIDYIKAGIKEELTIGTGDGATTNFSGTITTTPVIPDTVVVQAGVQTLTDDGDGNLTGDGTGTVDYDTGVITAVFGTFVNPGENVVVTSRYLKQYQRGETEETVSTAASRWRGKVTYAPVVPGTFALSDGSQVIYDDGDGNLVGDIDATGKNIIDYDTGSYDATFASALVVGSTLSSTYRQYLNTNSDNIPVTKSELAVLGNQFLEQIE